MKEKENEKMLRKPHKRKPLKQKKVIPTPYFFVLFKEYMHKLEHIPLYVNFIKDLLSKKINWRL